MTKQKNELFVSFVLHNPQKSHVCGLHWSLRQTLQKEAEGERGSLSQVKGKASV